MTVVAVVAYVMTCVIELVMVVVVVGHCHCQH